MTCLRYKKRDFFLCPLSSDISVKAKELNSKLSMLYEKKTDDRHDDIVSHSIPVVQAQQYKGRLWGTRTKPYVDRIASAWLIKNFIDQEAVCCFVKDISSAEKSEVTVYFDMQGGMFSHVGGTFEVLLKAFHIKARGLKKMAEIIHLAQ